MRTCNQLAAEEAIRFRKMCMLPPLETLVVTIVGSTELDGILSVTIPNRLLEDWANSRSTDTSFVALLNERIEDDISCLSTQTRHV